MRLTRVTLAIAIAGAFLLGLTPGASAHAATNTVATVAGEVTWPAGDTPGGDCSSVYPAGSTIKNPAIAGLPLAGPYRDRCFSFGSVVISSAGTWEQTLTDGNATPSPNPDPTHQTDFSCTSNGISGANGLPAGSPAGTAARADDPDHLGAFQGRYSCTVAASSTDPRVAVGTATAEQIFFGSSKANAIAFSGTAALLMLSAGNVNNKTNAGWTSINHTLTCAGRVDPLEVDTVNNTVVKAAAALDCTIA